MSPSAPSVRPRSIGVSVLVITLLTFAASAWSETARTPADGAMLETTSTWDALAVSSSRSAVHGETQSLHITLAPGDHAAFARTSGLGQLQAVSCTFNMTLAGDAGRSMGSLVLRMGSGFSSALADEPNARTCAALEVVAGRTTGEFRFRDHVSGRVSTPFWGTQAVTWVVNRSGAALVYHAPNGTSQSLATDHMDVWVGREHVFGQLLVVTPGAPIANLKGYWGSGSGVLAIDLLDLRDPTTTPGETPAVAADGGAATTVARPSSAPAIELYRPSPNPFDHTTRYAYAVAASERVDVGVFDIAGRRVRTLVRGTQTAGQYETMWDGLGDGGTRVKNGVYFLRATLGTSSRVARVVYLER